MRKIIRNIRRSPNRHLLRGSDQRMLKHFGPLLLAITLVAAAPIPVPKPSPAPLNSRQAQAPSKGEQTKSDKNQQGINDSAFTVKLTTPAKPMHEGSGHETASGAQAASGKEVANYTWYLSLWTFGLVLVALGQAMLFLWQLRYMRQTVADTAKAASASVKQAGIAQDTFEKLQRPYVFIWGIHERPQGGNPPNIGYSVTNAGQMAAVVENVSVRLGFENNGHFPTLVIIGDHSLLQSPILTANQIFSGLVHETTQSVSEYGIPVRLKNDCIFQVVITYRGPFTGGHETAQCWRYRKDPRGFVEVSDPTYTYIR